MVLVNESWLERSVYSIVNGDPSAGSPTETLLRLRADDSRLLGIPRSRPTITMIYPQHDALYERVSPLGQTTNVVCTIVARVQPRTSKGITDLL